MNDELSQGNEIPVDTPEGAEQGMVAETRVIRHDDAEASLPHQVNLPESTGIVLPDPIGFEVSLPKWVPMDEPGLIALHWWASLLTHLHTMGRVFRVEQSGEAVRAAYQLDKATRYAGQMVRRMFGEVVHGAIQAAAAKAAEEAVDMERGVGDHTELGCWTMILQTSFGIATVHAAGQGIKSQECQDALEVYEWARTSFESRMAAPDAAIVIVRVCTGTNSGTVEEKMDQWRNALQHAAEGMPEGAIPGLEEAIAVSEEGLPTHLTMQGPDGKLTQVPLRLIPNPNQPPPMHPDVDKPLAELTGVQETSDAVPPPEAHT